MEGYETITFKLNGLSALLMHSSRLVDPLDPKTKALKAATDFAKKTKTDEAEALKRWAEWEAGLYFDEEQGPCIPMENIIRMIRNTAARSRKGKHVGRAIIVDTTEVRLDYEGPRTLKGLKSSKKGFFFDKPARNGGLNSGSVIRRRPMFRDWSLTFTLHFDSEELDRSDLVAFVESAGATEGLGDWRPGSPKGGMFGRFKAEVLP